MVGGAALEQDAERQGDDLEGRPFTRDLVLVSEDVVEPRLGERAEPAQYEPDADAAVEPEVVARLRAILVGLGVVPAGAAEEVGRRGHAGKSEHEVSVHGPHGNVGTGALS